jgi:hypothetical protein
MASNSNSKYSWEYDNEEATAEINMKYVIDVWLPSTFGDTTSRGTDLITSIVHSSRW